MLLRGILKVIKWDTLTADRTKRPMPPNTFLDVLHNTFVKLPTKEDLAIPDPEAELVAALHVILDWIIPFLAYMTRGELPEDETLARQITRRSKSMTILTVSCIIVASLERFNIVFLLKKVKKFFVRSMKGIVVITPGKSLLCPKLFVMVFAG